jgi:hypothetical protein
MMSLYSLTETYVERMATDYSQEVKAILGRSEEDALAVVARELDRFTKGVLRRVAESERYNPDAWDMAIENSLATMHGEAERPDFERIAPAQMEELRLERELLARLVSRYWNQP